MGEGKVDNVLTISDKMNLPIKKNRENKEVFTIILRKMSNGITTVSVTYPRKDGAPPNTIIFFVNTQNNGYTVQHIEYGGVYVMDITWSQINNTWVPTAYVLKSNSDIGVEWRIEWKSVNEKVDPKLFTVEDMVSDVKEVVPLFTRELGPALHIGVVGADIVHCRFVFRHANGWNEHRLLNSSISQ